VFEKKLLQDGYVAITLAWDRHVDLVKQKGNNKHGEFEDGDTFRGKALVNLDLYLLPKGAKLSNQAIARSISTKYSAEHIFFKIPKTAEYEFWVVQVDAGNGAQPYGVAWWAVSDHCPPKKK